MMQSCNCHLKSNSFKIVQKSTARDLSDQYKNTIRRLLCSPAIRLLDLGWNQNPPPSPLKKALKCFPRHLSLESHRCPGGS